MTIAYSVFADGLSQTPVFASPLDRGRFIRATKKIGRTKMVRPFSLPNNLRFAPAEQEEYKASKSGDHAKDYNQRG